MPKSRSDIVEDICIIFCKNILMTLYFILTHTFCPWHIEMKSFPTLSQSALISFIILSHSSVGGLGTAKKIVFHKIWTDLINNNSCFVYTHKACCLHQWELSYVTCKRKPTFLPQQLRVTFYPHKIQWRKSSLLSGIHKLKNNVL